MANTRKTVGSQVLQSKKHKLVEKGIGRDLPPALKLPGGSAGSRGLRWELVLKLGKWVCAIANPLHSRLRECLQK